MQTYITGVICLLIAWLLIGAWRLRRRRVTLGPAAAGTMDKLLDDQKKAAIEIIQEERAGARDPEHRDGNLPDLENPTRPPTE